MSALCKKSLSSFGGINLIVGSYMIVIQIVIAHVDEVARLLQ